MKKTKLITLAAVAAVTALALTACGGSQPAKENTSAAPAPAATSAAPTSPAAAPAVVEETSVMMDTSALDTSAIMADYEAFMSQIPTEYDIKDVNPELVSTTEQITGLIDQYVALVDQAKTDGYDKVKDQIEPLNDEITSLSQKLGEIAPQDPATADMAYYMEKLVPELTKFADAGFQLIDIVQAQ